MENHVKKSAGKLQGSILECVQTGKILTINFFRDYNISICGKRGMFRNGSLKKKICRNIFCLNYIKEKKDE